MTSEPSSAPSFSSGRIGGRSFLGVYGLLGATALGALLAGGSAWRVPDGTGAAGGEAAALIDGEAISKAEFDRAVAALATAKRNPLTQADRAKILNRLIEEELLVRRALEIGLAKSDRSVRAAMVNAMVAQATSPVAARQPGDAELRAWYEERKDFFKPQPLLRVAPLAVADPTPSRLEEATQAIAEGRGVDAMRDQFGGSAAPPLPDGLLPLSKIKDYVGGEVAKALSAIPAGGWAGPFRVDDLALFYAVVERRDSPAPSFEEARARIAAAWRRSEADKAFREYLDWLESRARVVRRIEGARSP